MENVVETAKEISLDNAKTDKLFYFVANVVVYRESDARCLILKRSETEKVHPSKYCVLGGKLEWSDMPLHNPTRIQNGVLDYLDAVESLLAREAKEEGNVEIDTSELKYINSVSFVRPDGIPVVLVKFAAKYIGGEVVPEAGAFTDFAWVNAAEVQNYECIEGIKEEVVQTIRLFKR